MFPDGTEQLFRFLQGRFDRRLIGAAIADDDYVEHALHHDELRISDILLVSADWLPAIVDVLTAFIASRAGIRQRDTVVESKIHYKDPTGKFVSLDYRGPAKSYERTLKKLFPDEDASGTDAEKTSDEN